ncbi:TetR/AcrR family transcriptional regulator [Pseudonocardia sp. KRD291]|uniref:TetR/AcrR family transcriptional regulator n=1 Tax=Pseudonocardia sp. KRD291 TaxID=2792007 RepID=UPI001C4A712C|nr:TetR/AcrR family transcriptional regulator [Pseudonocardia sp. KRD291]MBW0105878.1 TetR/AcrR family transcriptional regulator [Pseudonocardia sp. KRD291]
MTAVPAGPEADERADRVLDSAAELLLRWGYRRVTIEDVARHAGIGKGTVYLHFRTKDALFLTVLLRAGRRIFAELAERMEGDPAVSLPWGMVRFVYELLQGDDLARVLYLGDPEVLGRLAQEAAGTLGELGRRRDEAVREHFGLLRGAGLVATDLPLDEQVHAYGAVTTGFFFAAGTPPEADPFAPADPARRAALLEHTLRSLLRGPADPAADPAAVTALAPSVAALYRPLVAHIDAEWQRRAR